MRSTQKSRKFVKNLFNCNIKMNKLLISNKYTFTTVKKALTFNTGITYEQN